MNAFLHTAAAICQQELHKVAANAKGRFPLHFVLESGKLWKHVKSLFQAATQLLHHVDVHTQLVPVALAAVAAGSITTTTTTTKTTTTAS